MSNQTELPWLAEARQHIGLTEIAGKQHNSIIGNWLISLKAWWTDDETPWCGTFVAHCARTAGRDLPKHWYRALDWQNTGTRLNAPAYGCVVVFARQGGGHVGFCVGQDEQGNLWILGGNQGNRVSVAKFARERAVAYVWLGKDGVSSLPKESRYDLPVLQLAGEFSRNEA